MDRKDAKTLGARGTRPLDSGRKAAPPTEVIPTLVMGLGGQGRRIAEHLKVRLTERYEQLPEGYGFEQHVKFLCVDTNVHESFGAPYPSDPSRSRLELSGDELFSISNTPIEDLKKGSHVLGKLLPPELYSDQIYQGAQQIRRLGRVALLYQYANFRSMLETTIRKLLQPAKNPPANALRRLEDDRLQVYVACSICGGTGSGTFIDVAYIIRDIMSTRHKEIAVNIIGVFLLPEVFDITGTAAVRIRANAYAALLDLEYYNQPVETEKPLYQLDLGQAGGFPSASAPFNHCYLVQGSEHFSEMKQIAPVIGDILETLICTPLGGKVDGQLDNIRPQFVRYQNGFRTFYSTFGIGRIIIPQKRMRHLRSRQIQRILIQRYILGKRPTLYSSVRSSTANRNGTTETATDKLPLETAKVVLQALRGEVDRVLASEQGNLADRTSFSERNGKAQLVEVLALVDTELSRSPDSAATLRRACGTTAERFYALTRLRMKIGNIIAGEMQTWVQAQLVELLKNNWQQGGGLRWLRAVLEELLNEVALERGTLSKDIALHEQHIESTSMDVQIHLDAVDRLAARRNLGAWFGGETASKRASKAAKNL
jgi:hypothetical protein